MEQGFVPDATYGSNLVSCWYEGEPQKSFWTGTKIEKGQGVPMGAFRCSRCGYVEFYADDEFTAR